MRDELFDYFGGQSGKKVEPIEDNDLFGDDDDAKSSADQPAEPDAPPTPTIEEIEPLLMTEDRRTEKALSGAVIASATGPEDKSVDKSDVETAETGTDGWAMLADEFGIDPVVASRPSQSSSPAASRKRRDTKKPAKKDPTPAAEFGEGLLTTPLKKSPEEARIEGMFAEPDSRQFDSAQNKSSTNDHRTSSSSKPAPVESKNAEPVESLSEPFDDDDPFAAFGSSPAQTEVVEERPAKIDQDSVTDAGGSNEPETGFDTDDEYEEHTISESEEGEFIEYEVEDLEPDSGEDRSSGVSRHSRARTARQDNGGESNSGSGRGRGGKGQQERDRQPARIKSRDDGGTNDGGRGRGGRNSGNRNRNDRNRSGYERSRDSTAGKSKSRDQTRNRPAQSPTADSGFGAGLLNDDFESVSFDETQDSDRSNENDRSQKSPSAESTSGGRSRRRRGGRGRGAERSDSRNQDTRNQDTRNQEDGNQSSRGRQSGGDRNEGRDSTQYGSESRGAIDRPESVFDEVDTFDEDFSTDLDLDSDFETSSDSRGNSHGDSRDTNDEESRGSGRKRRSRRGRGRGKRDDEARNSRDDHQRNFDDHDVDDSNDRDSQSKKRPRIPTWDEAIGTVIDSNMKSRGSRGTSSRGGGGGSRGSRGSRGGNSRNSGGGGSRGGSGGGRGARSESQESSRSSARNDSSRNDSSRNDSSRNDSSRNDSSRNDSSRNDSSRGSSRRSQSNRADSSRETRGAQPDISRDQSRGDSSQSDQSGEGNSGRPRRR